jgi:general secretion pathway protein D
MTADERTNKIFILTRASNFNFFDQIIAELDAKVEPDVVMKVIDLDYANSEDVASLLNSLITGAAPTPVRRTTTPTTTTGARPPSVPPPPVSAVSSAAGSSLEASGFLQFAEGVRIIPDARVNSILVMATKEDLSRIESLIKSIDTPVAQVLIEVVIAEVQLDGRLDIGVEAFKRQFEVGQASQAGGTRTGQPNPPLNLNDIAGLSSNLAPLALSSGLTYFASFNNLKLDAVIRLLSTSSRFKVLSTPIIQTLHNQEAHIIVGESRPIVSQTVADIVSAGSTAVRSSVEYKDIAIELTVTPRINPDGNVTMDIEQKINDLGGSVNVNGIETPIITKREAKSSVMVKDQNTIVLGGLIRENKTITETKVPILGDIPLLGIAFKGKSTTKARTELIVFIRPTVLRGNAAAMAEAKRRSEMLKASEELELHKKFPSEPLPASSKTPGQTAPAPKVERKETAVETDTKAAAVTPTDRQSAKIKALKMQDGDAVVQ